MKRLTVGTLMGVAGGKHDKQVVVKADQMLRGTVQTKPRLRFQALLYEVGCDIPYAKYLMSDMGFWARDNEGIADVPSEQWIRQQSDPIIDGEIVPPLEHQKAMQRMLEQRRVSRAEKAADSALTVSLELDQRVLRKEATALDAKYAGDKFGWVSRANPAPQKQQQMSVGNLVINAGQPPRVKKPVRIDKRDTKRLAEAIEAEVKVIG